MKKTLIALVFLPAIIGTCWARNFSAFTHERILYLTVLGDNCNNFGYSLDVDELCLEDRISQNYAKDCRVGFWVVKTDKKCKEHKQVPVVIPIDLNISKIASEVEVLLLTHLDTGEQIQVPIL